MKFLNNLKSKKRKKDYETLLELKDDLDQVSLKTSILNHRISLYEKNSDLSSKKIDTYKIKIQAAYKKENLELCKKGFLKYHKETLIYAKSKETLNTLHSTYDILTEELTKLQESYSLLEDEYSKNLSQNQFFLKDFFKSSMNDFSLIYTNILALIIEIETFVPESTISLCLSDEESLFSNDLEFEEKFNAFIKEISMPFN